MNPTSVDSSCRQMLNVENDALYEIEYGQWRELEPMGARDVLLATMLCFHVNSFAQPKKLGVAVNEMLFVIDARQDLKRRPDVAFVSFGRWPEKTVTRDNAWNVVPDLAVEVVSPTNLAEDVENKTVEYLDAGVRLVWVLYPDLGRVYVYGSPTDVRVLEKTDALDGGDVLPGFRLPITALYEAATKPE